MVNWGYFTLLIRGWQNSMYNDRIGAHLVRSIELMAVSHLYAKQLRLVL